NKYAMFEAIHGSAPRMVEEGRAQYADPCSVMRAVVLLLSHIGYQNEAEKLEKALDICTVTERKIFTTGRSDGATNEELTNYIIDTIKAM
ncbi:MAG: isocitrate/isopropylmalate dehydrogenase family protein, partial [Firmicutes bacterium]|nr:isocitrate/isopropylmalate dehydrogenase family protein [Bacillota bacterium]